MQKLQDTYSPERSITCFLHKRQKATHLCIDLRCYNNPILCNQCLQENNHRTQHHGHDSSVIPIPEAVEKFSSLIKAQAKEVQRIYSNTIGLRDHENLQRTLEKGDLVLQEVDNRLRALKTQIELELDLLVKEFQKRILLQKEDFFKNLDNYQKQYSDMYESVRKNTEQIMDYQRGLKYYANSNNLLLKIAQESRRKSVEWFIQKKRIVGNTTKIVENPLYVPDTIKNCQTANGFNFEKIPNWSAEEQASEKGEELGQLIKKFMENWVKIPDLRKTNEPSKIADYKYVPYSPYNR